MVMLSKCFRFTSGNSIGTLVSSQKSSSYYLLGYYGSNTTTVMYESNPTAIIPPPGHLTYDYLRIGGHLTEVYSARSGI